MNNKRAIEYLDAVSQDIHILKNGEEFDRHQFQSMIDLLDYVMKYLEQNKEGL
jgi:hypothetical protein